MPAPEILLTEDQRLEFTQIPQNISEYEIAKFYTFSPYDINIVSSSSEKVVEKDQEMTSEVQEGESGGKNTSSSETAVYANGNGEETPYVKQELSPRIEGVLVIADGGDNAIVIENITEAVQALFGVDTHKIKVMKHN